MFWSQAERFAFNELSVFSLRGETFLASPLSPLWAWLVGFLCSLLIGGAAYWKGSLTRSGWVAAVAVGTLLFALGNLVWFACLIAFFVSSSVLSKWKRYVKRQAEASYEKSGGRDAWQVAANGLPGTLLCVAHAIWPSPLWLVSFVGIMAAVNADTWATEIGGLSRFRPRSILSGKPVPTGTSGGVSLLGTAASVVGAGFIGVSAWICLYLSSGSATDATGMAQSSNLELLKVGVVLVLSAAIGGTIGAFVDSLLGATLQRMYRCTVCGSVVERQQHCGKPTEFVRGIRWMNNDAVNIISSLFGAVVALGIGLIYYQTTIF
ncbi:MAG: DUF92 domain-containing protein [Gorillibacterium sp.]|nr:DUF92 domain-containing protein [Gorillibacterium sp.]